MDVGRVLTADKIVGLSHNLGSASLQGRLPLGGPPENPRKYQNRPQGPTEQRWGPTAQLRVGAGARPLWFLGREQESMEVVLSLLLDSEPQVPPKHSLSNSGPRSSA